VRFNREVSSLAAEARTSARCCCSSDISAGRGGEGRGTPSAKEIISRECFSDRKAFLLLPPRAMLHPALGISRVRHSDTRNGVAVRPPSSQRGEAEKYLSSWKEAEREREREKRNAATKGRDDSKTHPMLKPIHFGDRSVLTSRFSSLQRLSFFTSRHSLRSPITQQRESGSRDGIEEDARASARRARGGGNRDEKVEKDGCRPTGPFKVPRRQQRASNELIKLSNSFGLASERANKCSPLPRGPLQRARAPSAEL